MTDRLYVEIKEFFFGSRKVLGEISFQVSAGEVVAVMGPSGCGKSTMLRVIAGIASQKADANILVDGVKLKSPGPSRQFLFQDIDALPWLTAWENMRQLCSTANSEELNDALSSVGLQNHKEKYPSQLSGGMLKKLSIARLIASHPKVVLMDEPFSSIDPGTRSTIIANIQRIIALENFAAVLVTHDIDDVMKIASKLLVCSGPPMKVEQIFFAKDSIAQVPKSNLMTNDNIRTVLERIVAE